MKVYLAHNFGAAEYLRCVVKPILEAYNHEVTSRWIYEVGYSGDKSDQQAAIEDLEDIDKAGALILFVDSYSADKPGRGKFVELGYALRAGKRIILVGKDRNCVFYAFPNIRHVSTVTDAMMLL